MRDDAKINVPRLWFMSWYDVSVGPNLELYNYVRKTASPAVANEQWAIIAPVAHCSYTRATADTIAVPYNDLTAVDAVFAAPALAIVEVEEAAQKLILRERILDVDASAHRNIHDGRRDSLDHRGEARHFVARRLRRGRRGGEDQHGDGRCSRTLQGFSREKIDHVTPCDRNGPLVRRAPIRAEAQLSGSVARRCNRSGLTCRGPPACENLWTSCALAWDSLGIS